MNQPEQDAAGCVFLYSEGGRGENRDNRAHAVKDNGRALCGSSVTVWAIDSEADAPSCFRCKQRLKARRKAAPHRAKEGSTDV